ncbi:DUF2867 domain-containing protein [Empedobacter brevis]
MIIRAKLPDKSVLKKENDSFDYIDSYQSSFSDETDTIDSTKVGKLFFAGGPKWIGSLFTARNKIVRLFGLKTPGILADRQKQLDNFKCEKGEQFGLFKVFDKTKNEVILGEDDKHLNFRISLFLDTIADTSEQKNLIITTTVKFNNVFGRLYFLPVRPFHKLIVPAILKGVIKQIENEK